MAKLMHKAGINNRVALSVRALSVIRSVSGSSQSRVEMTNGFLDAISSASGSPKPKEKK